MKARLIGPALMIVLGAVLLAAPGGASSMDIGEVNPCTTTTTSTTFPIVKAAAGKAQEAPCGCYDRAAIVDPCATTTTGTPGTPVSFPTTTTTEAPTTTVQTTTTAAETTTTEGTTDTTVIEPTTMVEPTTTMAATTTTAGGGVSGADTTTGTGGATLARTGSNPLPMTMVGISLIVAGFALAIAGQRRARLAAVKA